MGFAIQKLDIDGMVVVTPDTFPDDRGFFMEVFRADKFKEAGLPTVFSQQNVSVSRRGVIRGLHFQWEPPQGKLMRVVVGSAFLVAVDIRKNSPTLGRWLGITASAMDRKQLWAPAGFARGFCAMADTTEIEYKCTGTYNPLCESGIRWNDPEIGIKWPVNAPMLSDKDRNARTLSEWLKSPESDKFSLPQT